MSISQQIIKKLLSQNKELIGSNYRFNTIKTTFSKF